MVRVGRNAHLIEDIQHERQVLFPFRSESNTQTALGAMIRRLGRSIFGMRSLRDGTIKGLQLSEASLHAIPLEEIISHHRSPLVIIIASANSVNPEIDRTAPSEDLSARIIDLSAVAVFLRSRLVPQVQVTVRERRPSLAIDLVRGIIVAFSGFHQGDSRAFGRPGQFCSEGATSRTTYNQCQHRERGFRRETNRRPRRIPKILWA